MVLRRLFGGGSAEPEAKNDPLAPRPPSADHKETQTIRKIVAQLEALPVEQRRFVAGYAYILGRAAHADLVFGADEVAAIEKAVMDVSGLPEAQAVLLVEMARNQAELYGATEDFLVTREFARTASQADREQLLRAAFRIGAADQTITSMESAELNQIGKELGFPDAEVDAIRNEFRDSLSVLQAMRQMAVHQKSTEDAPAS